MVDEHRGAGAEPAAAACLRVTPVAALGQRVVDGDVLDGDQATLDEEHPCDVVAVDGVAVSVESDGMDPVAADHRQPLGEGDVGVEGDDVVVGHHMVGGEVAGDLEDRVAEFGFVGDGDFDVGHCTSSSCRREGMHALRPRVYPLGLHP